MAPRGHMHFERARAVLKGLFSGTAQEKVQAELRQLPISHRYSVLCTACRMRPETEVDGPERSQTIDEILKKNCPFYFGPRVTCALPLGVLLKN
jgi:hypothetical protein